ncbi:outer membrane lipid asymmetry maintenance protein MlaD [Lysobacter enzymogenes]|uniref:ABC transporter substrate-binding protein n=1 Tax=Lysobacter enzymogenes TaxID=69 RepID=A0AAU9AIP9_LYSEN|nr:outer membrane lipid asymmetry maintenance protein MlaD [Lysobacter enzymogenes]BAV95570.1 ABC transporter substrate-binding protein [Lysobacter enzymogenes]SDY20218.1 phospholipid/cholesterol/gamma-HCH transport system substrate-binding protein [Lysobacter enzymogenes]
MSVRSPRIEFAVGAFLLLALASLLVLAIASTNGKFGFGRDNYEVTAKFTSIGALRPNAPVKIGGVNVGQVADISLDPKSYASVVTLSIDKRYNKLSADTSAGIFTSGLLGESYIGLTPGGDPDDLKPGDEIYLTQPAIDLIQLVGKYMFSGGGAQGGGNASGGDAAKPADAGTPDYLKGEPTAPSSESKP